MDEELNQWAEAAVRALLVRCVATWMWQLEQEAEEARAASEWLKGWK